MDRSSDTLSTSVELDASKALDRRSTEAILGEVLAGVVGQDVSVDSNFFEDLGADSMLMAQFCARLRKRSDVASVSMKDVYRHPTIEGLALLLDEAARDQVTLAQGAPHQTALVQTPLTQSAGRTDLSQGARDLTELVVPTPTPTPEQPTRASTAQYVLCGMMQLLAFVAYAYLTALVASTGYVWVSEGSRLVDIYLRSVLVAGGTFVAMCTLPVVAKWLLIGRWKPQEIQIWSLGYFRFWLVRTLVRASPLVLMMPGSPLYSFYLRTLGAKVGRGVVIHTRTIPVCTDLLTIGDGTVIRKDSVITGYRGHAGRIQTGPVTLGRDVFIGEKTVLDISTSMGDSAQLGHSSSLNEGQAVPAYGRWHGSPAQPCDVDYRGVRGADCAPWRGVLYAVFQLLAVLLVYLPVALGGVAMLVAEVPQVSRLLNTPRLEQLDWAIVLEALSASLVLLVGLVAVGLVLIAVVPRLLNRVLAPDRVYPLYGLHYSAQLTITRFTNSKFFTYLFGDSSYIVGYLRWLGYDLSNVEQTGSNFGTGVTHSTPYLASVGRGTMVADGLSIINADFSSTSFRVSRASIGAHNFLGNQIAYPSQGKTGENCLLATKVMVPIDGQVREGVGLLGSPCFEIPRSVQRDTSLEIHDPAELRRRLRAKNRHNLTTMALALLVRWLHLCGLTILAMLAADFYRSVGAAAIATEIVASLVFTASFFVLVERIGTGFRPLQPQSCSIYDPYFWWHERFWKLAMPQLDRVLAGTPYKNVLARLLGVRLGRRVFDDGCFLPERTLVTIGDDCTLNQGSVIQCHSQEDGAFKSDRSSVGAGSTLGIMALVHYGVTVGPGAVLAADSFLMKGEEVPPNAHWGGNPARPMSRFAVGHAADRLAVTSGDQRR